MARPTKTGLPVTAHINPDLHQRLVEDAKRAFRSLSSEIEMRLSASYEQQDAAAAGQAQLIKEVAETTANAVAEHFVLRILERDWLSAHAGGALRGWKKVPTGDEAKALLRRPHMEVGRGASTPKPELTALKDLLQEAERLAKVTVAHPEAVDTVKKQIAAHKRTLTGIIAGPPAKATEDK
jgi:hypothetical protein